MKTRSKARSVEEKGISLSAAFDQMLMEEPREETQQRDESKGGSTLTESVPNDVCLSHFEIARQGNDMPNISDYMSNTETELEDYHSGSEADDVDYITHQQFIEVR